MNRFKLQYFTSYNFWVLLGSPILLWCLLTFGNNGVPLITSDSGAYLLNARELKIPFDRTIFYSLLTRFFMDSEAAGFGIALFNTLLFPFVCFNFLYFRLNSIKELNLSLKYLVFGYVLAMIFTPLPWLFIQIMPDVYTPVLCLALLHFLTAKNKKQRWFFGLISVLSTIMHNGNLILVSTLFVILCGFYIRKIVLDFSALRNMVFLVLGGWASVIGSNLIVGNGFTASKASHIFLMAKFAESGLLKNYLDDNCQSKPNSLCVYKDDLPEHAWDFIWPEQSILSKTGGWHNSKEEYSKIINSIVTDPYFLAQLIFKSVEATYLQCLVYGAGDGLGKLDNSSTVYSEMVNYHKSYKHKLDASFQQVESTSFSDFNLFYRFMALFIVAVLFLTWSKSKLKTFMVFSFLFMICNAFSTGAFANILMRLNTRGAAIFIVFALLFIIQRIGDSGFLLKFMANSKFKISSKR